MTKRTLNYWIAIRRAIDGTADPELLNWLVRKGDAIKLEDGRVVVKIPIRNEYFAWARSRPEGHWARSSEPRP